MSIVDNLIILHFFVKLNKTILTNDETKLNLIKNTFVQTLFRMDN